MAGGRDRRLLSGLGAVTLAAAALRLLCARGDLWLDEVWTLILIGGLDSPVELLTRLAHDNNHVLNSALVWALRAVDDPLSYRLPAVLAGTAAVALAAAIAYAGDLPPAPGPGSPAVRAAFAAGLHAVSVLMVQYESEARGYALALAFGLLGPWALLRARGEPGAPHALLHWAGATFGILGHPVAVHLVAGTVAWSLLAWWRQGRRGAALLRAAAWWHAVPVVAAGSFHLGFLRRVQVGGGPETGLATALAEAFAYTLGLPLALGPLPILALSAALVAGGLLLNHRDGGTAWAFVFTAVVLSPALALALQPGGLRFPRYFFTSMAVVLLLAATLLARLWTRSRLAAAALATLFVAGHLPRLHALARDQRGHYRSVIAHMLAATGAGDVRVASDHDFRNPMLLAYHVPRLRGGERVEYVPQAAWAKDGAEWYLAHRLGGAPPPEGVVRDVRGHVYRLQRSAPSAPLSGFRWYLYRRD